MSTEPEIAVGAAAVEPPEQPEPELEVVRAAAVEGAATPTVSFRLAVSDPSHRPVFTIALSVLIAIEPAKRSYDERDRERLVELFGEPGRWATTTVGFRWAQADVLVPRFAGSTEVELPIACTYDLELAASKYFYGLASGEVPLRFHFNGTVYYEAADGRLQLLLLPWDRSVRFRMPVDVWRRAIEAHYPFRRWLPVEAATLERLRRLKVERGLPTFDAALGKLLDREEAG